MMRSHLLAVCLLVGVGCGGGGDGYREPSNNPTGPNTPNPNTPNNPPSNNASVGVQDNQYSPETVNITTGTTVVWTWAAGNYAAHSVTFNDGNTSSASKTSGTHQRTFQSAGTFSYYCEVHGTAMTGSVVVTAP
jgi:plastocyanin